MREKSDRPFHAESACFSLCSFVANFGFRDEPNDRAVFDVGALSFFRHSDFVIFLSGPPHVDGHVDARPLPRLTADFQLRV